MPHYRKHGKLLNPLTIQQFVHDAALIKNKRQQAFAVLLYFTGLRRNEVVRAVKEQFQVTDGLLIFDVGPREKTKHVTPPLQLPLELPLMDNVVHVIKYTKKGERLFPFCSRTGYNIIDRYFNAYPHYFRLNRITQFLVEGFSLPEVMSWSGHKTFTGINQYLGQVNITKLGKSLLNK